MRSLIFLGLVALACSQGFLRNLQTDSTMDTEIPPVNGTNGTNSTNGTLPANDTSNLTNSSSNASNASNTSNSSTNASGVGAGSTTSAPNSSVSSLGSIAPIDLSGNWSVINTNCSSTCAPTYFIQNNGSNSTTIEVTVTFPQDQNCGQWAGQIVNVSEIANAGVWFDLDNSSSTPLSSSIAMYNQWNQTILLIVQDVANNGSFCWQDLSMSAANSSNTTNTTNTTSGVADQETTPVPDSETPVQNASNSTNSTNTTSNFTWEGAWQASAVSLANADGQCCVPDVPILIHSDNVTNSVQYAFRAPDCPACGMFQNTVIFGQAGVQENFVIHNSTFAGYSDIVVLYPTTNGTIVSVNQNCAIEFTKVVAPSC